MGTSALVLGRVSAAAGVFAVRFWGAVTAIKHAAPRMREGGSITLTDGMIAHRPRKGAAISTAMAGAVEHLALALAVDLAPVLLAAATGGLPDDLPARIPASDPAAVTIVLAARGPYRATPNTRIKITSSRFRPW